MTHDALRRATDDRSWRRGDKYFRGGHIVDLFEDGGVVYARILGQSTYRVRVWMEEGEACGDCTCPMGAEGVFCKHCVAVGLACLECQGTGACLPALDGIREHLKQLPTSELVDLLMRRVREDDEFRERLRLDIALTREDGPDIAAVRQAIDDAMMPNDYVDYYAASGFAAHIQETVNAIAGLLDTGHADAVIALTEQALERWEEAMACIDDSDGEMTPIQERLAGLHHDACLIAEPDPVELARRLFDWEIDGDWDTFYGAASSYADVLGERGLAEYRRLAERAWAELPERGSRASGFEADSRRFRMRSVMESLARARGDIDGLIEIKSKDLSSPSTYLEIAELLRGAERNDEALSWAERGQRDFGSNPDARLEAFLIDEYRRRGRDDEALHLRWSQFQRHPSLQRYRELHGLADDLGRWPQWQDKALRHLGHAAGSSKRPRRPKDEWAWEMLIEVLLWEGRADEAWHESKRGECSLRLTRQLAAARAVDHPEEAAHALRPHAEDFVQETNQRAYEQASELIVQVKAWMARAEQEKEFEAWLGDLRARHKRKRNFIKLIQSL